ncbi:MAG TPA: FtsQ-type POTRA domain-containing protein [Candidatus Angelobacter sp.]|nr:FtsQ-type POTRA domain-containing protein [Candidatus Angelobacter sp.]
MSDKKVIQLDDRIPKLKAQRRQKANQRFIFYITIFFILILIVTYIESPLSNVKSVAVSGNRYIQADQIVKSSGLSTGSKIWSVNQDRIQKKLKSIPSIKQVTVKSHYFGGRVDLKISEFKRVAYVKRSGSYKPVLANGKWMPLPNNTPIPVNAPILVGFTEGKELTGLTQQLAKMEAETLYNISEIDRTPSQLYPYGITLYFNDGNKALGNIPSLAEKMKLYPSILSSIPAGKKGVIQLRVGSYWKAYPDQQEQGGTTNAK